jgi:Fur family ferric uptake transcriptional regulator
MQSGRVIEFQNAEIEALQREVARRFGYKLVGHRLELYAVPLTANDKAD